MSRVENGFTIPKLGKLERVARALEAPVAEVVYVFRRCAPIALTGYTTQILALGEKHNVLSETQQFRSSCTYINRTGGAVSGLKTPAGTGSAMLRHFHEDVGGWRRSSGAAVSATTKAPEAESFS